MQAADTLIAWTPAEFAVASAKPEWRRTAGCVALVPWPDTEGEAKAYARLDGALTAGWRSACSELLVARVFIVFSKLVLVGGISPLTAHVVFLGLQEYRENLPVELIHTRRQAEVLRLDSYRRRGPDYASPE